MKVCFNLESSFYVFQYSYHFNQKNNLDWTIQKRYLAAFRLGDEILFLSSC